MTSASEVGVWSSSAVISDDGVYRYSLTRRWGDGPSAVFIMLNPSTADATQDDPTIRRCIGFAKREGCASLTVVNLFAYRATDPRALLDAEDPQGPDNSRHITRALLNADLRIAAWGAFQWTHRERLRRPYVEDWAGGKPLLCLGTTSAGAPRHPLYVKGDQPLVEWSS